MHRKLHCIQKEASARNFEGQLQSYRGSVDLQHIRSDTLKLLYSIGYAA